MVYMGVWRGGSLQEVGAFVVSHPHWQGHELYEDVPHM